MNEALVGASSVLKMTMKMQDHRSQGYKEKIGDILELITNQGTAWIFPRHEFRVAAAGGRRPHHNFHKDILVSVHHDSFTVKGTNIAMQ